MNQTARTEGEWVFFTLLTSYVVIYLVFYPASFSISDETSILALSYSIAHGSVFPDHVGPVMGLQVGNHTVSKYSPFHAALLVPPVVLNWRSAFLVSAAFFIAGAFVIRAMLLRADLSSDWVILYFLLAGPLYYSQTLMPAVPSAVVALYAVSLLMREDPRPLVAGAAFGVSVLLHPWGIVVAAVFSAVWCIESGRQGVLRNSLSIGAGALPAIVAIAIYNQYTTGNPFRNVYTMLQHQWSFGGEHFSSFFPFYLISLAVFPIGGWSSFSPRYSRGYALPATAIAVLMTASLYFYRDGLNVYSARVVSLAALAGAVPGQRFLLPLSMIACVPAARFLSARLGFRSEALRRAIRPAALAGFAAGFTALSFLHQGYLRAHAELQDALDRTLPADRAVLVSPELAKELTPVRKTYSQILNGAGRADAPSDAYVAWLGFPGQAPPQGWFAGRETDTLALRSWVWNRDLWIGRPANINSARSQSHAPDGSL